MTNSVLSGKCPSILTSGKYGMSQRRSNIDDSKEYIFVKLTDSAFRAIEEYQRNTQSKRLQKGQCAKIQFLGNAGIIQFPPTATTGGAAGSNGITADGRKFGFAIDDVEGSLECIQQSGEDLDVLGSLNYRMRIHANDDVYDTTRTKMAIAEETEKSKCIREIKPNQTDIGRTVKRPVSAAAIQAYSNGGSSLLNGLSNGHGSSIISNSTSSNINGSSSYFSNNITSSNNNNNTSRNKLSAITLNQHSPPPSGAGGIGGGANASGTRLSAAIRSSPNSSINGSTVVGGGNSTNSSNRYGSPSNLCSSNLSSMPSNGIGDYSPPSIGNGPHMSKQKKSNIGNSSRGNCGGVTVTSVKNSLGANNKMNGVTNGKNLDVSRRKIRERLIHLLALKPFKKPELYARLQNEGLATRERQLISTILKDISTLSRDNTYNLRRSLWNDVDENWQFFSEQEIQQLKRRKPQNLTPPMSSDAGSSTSGQSPTSSTHTGSPPPLANGVVNGVGSLKRTSLESDIYDTTLTMGMQSKKQRISHYKKDGSVNVGSSLVNISNLCVGPKVCMVGGGGRGKYRSSSAAATYSPHTFNAGNISGNDDNSGNSDLTFNVLNNMDDFIQNTAVVGGDTTFAGRSSKSTTASNQFSPSTNNSSTVSAIKEKRNSGGGCTFFTGYSSNREPSASSCNSVLNRKNSPTTYCNNFVPETKTPTNTQSNSNVRLNKQEQQQQGQRKKQQSSPSVIPNTTNDDYSPSLAPPSSAAISNSTISSSRLRHHSNSLETTNEREPSLSNKHSRSTTPAQKHFSKHHSCSSSKNTATAGFNVQQKPNNQHKMQEDQNNGTAYAHSPLETGSQHSSQSNQQQEHSSPTQQIAAAASTFSLTNHSTPSGDAPRYDFSSYTPITSIEQRRKYKTEFESDYDEYRKLLAQVESVGHRFRELADRLSRVQQGCIDYYNIKDQIVNEYNRIRKEEAINRDKQRFDYLHEKLAHIKQLVMDYDKKLTSGLATVPTINTGTQQQEPLNQQRQQTVTNTSAHLSPMLQSSGESNHSPPLMLIHPTTETTGSNVDTSLVNSKSSLSSHTRRSCKHHETNHQEQEGNLQLQKQGHYQQHHEPETIQMDYNDNNEVEASLQYHPCNGIGSSNHFNFQKYKTTSVLSTTLSAKHKTPKHLQQNNNNNNINKNTNDTDSDSDSNSSSSSNCDDNSDDDNSDASEDDDDNSDDDSIDDDNDKQ